MNGHLQIKKVYKDERPDEVVVDDANTLSDGFYRTLINVFRNNGSDDVEDLRAAYFQIGNGTLPAYSTEYMDVDYTPSSMGGIHKNAAGDNTFETLSLWLPRGIAPSEGWPLYIFTPYRGWWTALTPLNGPPYTSSGLDAYFTLDGGSVYYEGELPKDYGKGTVSLDTANWLLTRGVAVAFVGLMGSQIETSGITSGTGTFCPSGTPRWEQEDTFFGVRDLVWAIQYLRYNASTYNLDPNLMVGRGGSAGAHTMMWVATQEFASATADDLQLRESTILQGLNLEDGMFWIPLFEQGVSHVVNGLLPASSTYDVSRGFCTEVCHNLSATWGGGDSYGRGQYQVLASPFYSSFNTPEKVERMKTFPFCFTYGSGGSVDSAKMIDPPDISLNSDDPPLPTLSGVVGTAAHSSWFGYAMYERLQTLNSSFHNTSSLLLTDHGSSSSGSSIAGDYYFTPSAIVWDASIDPDGYIPYQREWLSMVFGMDDSNYEYKSDPNFYEIARPLLLNTSYGLATNGGVENLNQLVASSGNYSLGYSNQEVPLAISSMPFAKMMPDNITKITPNGAHHRIEIDLAMANGQTISEVGLFAKNPEGQPNDSPLMMAYKTTFTPLTKESDFSFVFDWTIYL